jgi:DNA polymerase-4
MARTIFHADLDAFYASVEQLDNPELRGKPVVVGGPPESRGVVAAASYEAREFGIRSAMPMSQAVRRCTTLVRVPPRFDRYGELSREVMAIFRSLTPLIEPLSLDEAFLDVTNRIDGGWAVEPLARHLKKRVRDDTGLVLSIGAGTNKSIAKVASDMGKPDGLVIVKPGREASFLAPLPARLLWGVGPKAEAKLRSAGLRTIGDVAEADAAVLERLVGSRGVQLGELSRGIDERPVVAEQARKSIGAETTFPQDLPDGPQLRSALHTLSARVAERAQRDGKTPRTVVLKLRYADFRTITRQTTLAAPSNDGQVIANVVGGLLDSIVSPGDEFRLIGVSCTQFVEPEATEDGAIALPLWPAREQSLLL